MTRVEIRDRMTCRQTDAGAHCCPWCKALDVDGIEDAMNSLTGRQDRTISNCRHCGRDYLCHVVDDRFVLVGLRSPADVLYQRERMARHDSSSRP